MSNSTRLVAGLFALSTAALEARGQAPVVLALSPGRNAVAAPVAGPVGVQFSQAITAASASGLNVYGAQRGGRRAGTVGGGGSSSLSFAPAQPFAPGERVSVTVPATLLNAAGIGVLPHVYQFTAATGGDGRGLFLDTTEVAYAHSRDLLLGDLDNDGDLDLLGSSGFAGFYSYLNDGTGRFTAFRNTLVGSTPSGATLADVNQDGYLDLLAGDADNATLAIVLNTANGTGAFAGNGLGAQLLPVGNTPVGVVTGDIDGDGDLDVVTANNAANTASVSLNNGAGVFGAASTVSVGASPTAVQLADVDSDGDLDLLTSSRSLGTVSVRLNNGLGGFSGSGSVPVGATPSDLALADLDNDGDLDLLTCSSTARNISVRLNSSGTFSGGSNPSLPAGSTPTGLSTGDVDGDGDLDVVVAQGTGGQVLVLLNNGSGTLTLQPNALTVAGSTGLATTLGVVLGDVDSDGDLDVLTADGVGTRVVLGRGGALPTISAFSPSSAVPGSAIALVGTNLRGVRRVLFAGLSNNEAAGGYTSNANGTQLTGVVVPPGAATGAVSVTTGTGAVTSTVSFTVNAAQLAVLQGAAPLPPAGTGYDFGTWVLGTTAPTITFTLRNTGSQPLTITSTTATGDFAISSGPATLLVPVGGSTTVVVAFAPTGLGVRTGTLVVASNAAGFPSYVLPMRGTAVPAPPTLTALLPASAPTGDTISLSGTNLATTSTITFANSGSGSSMVSTGFVANAAGTQLTGVVVPAGAATGPVGVSTAGGTYATLLFTVLPPPPPSLQRLSPAAAHVSDTITLYGTRMHTATAVSFDGNICQPVSSTSTSLRVVVPANVGTGMVSLQSLAGNSNALSLRLLPLIIGLQPSAGPEGRNVLVTGYSGVVTGATFGGVPATFTTLNFIQYVVVPVGARSGSFRLICGTDTSNALPFTVTRPISLTGVSPATGPVGTSLTLTGTDLQGVAAVSFDGAGQNTVTTGFAVNAAGTQITGVIVPPGARTGYVTVTSANGKSVDGPFTVTGAVGPTVPAWQTLAGSTPDPGAGGTCLVQAIATGASGDVYLCGSFTGQTAFGSTVLNAGRTGQSGFVAKWNTGTGTYDWALPIVSRIGHVNALVVQGSSVYVAGSYDTSAQFGANILLTAALSLDGFVAKLTDAGTSASFVWARSAGGNGTDSVNGLAVQGTDVFIAGTFGSGSALIPYPLVLGSTTLNGAGGDDVFVAKLVDVGPSASYVWAQRAGGAGNDQADALAISGNGVYVGGTFCSGTAHFGALALRTGTTSVVYDYDGFVAKLTHAGTTANFSWAQAVHGTGLSNEFVTALAVNGNRVYAAGRYYATAILGGVVVSSAVASGGENGFVFKMTDNGASVTVGWGQAVQAVQANTATHALAVQGNAVYVVGYTSGPALAGNFTTTAPYGCYVARLDDNGPSGRFAWLKQGGGSQTHGVALCVRSSRVYVAGYAINSSTAYFDALRIVFPGGSGYGFFASLLDGVLTAAQEPARARGQLALYPNPARGSCTLLLPAGPFFSSATVTLHDALGRVVQTAQVLVPPAGLRYEVMLRGLPTGIYQVSFTTATTAQTTRLTVE